MIKIKTTTKAYLTKLWINVRYKYPPIVVELYEMIETFRFQKW